MARSAIDHLITGSWPESLAFQNAFESSAAFLFSRYLKECCCCSVYLSSCPRTASDANLLHDPYTFHYQDYFVNGGIRTCLGVFDDPTCLWISSNSRPLNLLLVRSHQAEIIIAKRLIQGRNNVSNVRIEPRSFDQGRRKNDAFTHSAKLLTSGCDCDNGSSIPFWFTQYNVWRSHHM